MVDAADLKSVARKGVWVRVPPSPPFYGECSVIGQHSSLWRLQREFESRHSPHFFLDELIIMYNISRYEK
jgi:hypothetical protein